MPTTFWQDRFKKALRDALVADSTLVSLVGANIQYGELAQLRARNYPIITYTLAGLSSSNGEYDHLGTLRIWVWTDKSQDQATAVWKRVKEVLFHATLSGADISFVVQPIHNAILRFETETSLWNYAGEFTFRAFDHERVP